MNIVDIVHPNDQPKVSSTLSWSRKLSGPPFVATTTPVMCWPQGDRHCILWLTGTIYMHTCKEERWVSSCKFVGLCVIPFHLGQLCPHQNCTCWGHLLARWAVPLLRPCPALNDGNPWEWADFVGNSMVLRRRCRVKPVEKENTESKPLTWVVSVHPFFLARNCKLQH